jgi:uncharacterized protein (TIGR03089 family)
MAQGATGRTPARVLADLLRSDPARPRVTFYDDTPGPTAGERVELSAKVFANWVNKAGNALQDEWDVGPGATVRLDLPPHWRALYWALATWTVGGTVVLGEPEGGPGNQHDLLVTTDPEAAAGHDPAVLVTLPALARSAQDPVPPGVMDEARELSTHGDQLAVWAEPADDDPALRTPAGDTAYGELVVAPDWPPGARVAVTAPDLDTVLRQVLAAWAVDGSVVLSRGAEPAGGRAARLQAEGVTVEA